MAIEEEAGPGIPEWVVTFGDMMSLLLTFFIMLVSMSELKEDERYQAMVESFRQQFGQFFDRKIAVDVTYNEVLRMRIVHEVSLLKAGVSALPRRFLAL